MDLGNLLEGFYKRISNDGRIGPTHISLYFALLYHSNRQALPGAFTIDRVIIMGLAKINSRQTYNRCMKEINKYGYIHYNPSSNPNVASRVFLILK